MLCVFIRYNTLFWSIKIRIFQTGPYAAVSGDRSEFRNEQLRIKRLIADKQTKKKSICSIWIVCTLEQRIERKLEAEKKIESEFIYVNIVGDCKLEVDFFSSSHLL